MQSTIPADIMMRTISYYYLVNYCPPSQVGALKEAAQPLRAALAEGAGKGEEEYFPFAAPEVGWRVTAFHQATREPDADIAQALADAVVKADASADEAAAFQNVMADLASHPGRAKLDNRLHRQKGCKFCMAPCRYGFFTLVSDPAFQNMLAMLSAEMEKQPELRNPVNVLWTYTATHLWRTLGVREAFIRADHLGNLSYCLLMLATAKSRFAVPEKQLQAYQAMNQDTIRNWRPASIDVMEAVEG
ncbi:MAG: hypothetical protein PVG63_06210 [Anaerolineales bacterium]|jgi:hypothetical protein